MTMCRWLMMSCLVFVGGVGCGAAESSSTDRPTPSADPLAVIPRPLDPDTEITVSVAGWDSKTGQARIVNQSRTTKGEQWRLMTEPDRPIGQSSAPSSDGVGTASSAVAQETCAHGSPLVLNNSSNFGGDYLCFNGSGPPDLLWALPSTWDTRSAYTVQPNVVMYEIANGTHPIVFCQDTPRLQTIGFYSGPRIGSIETPSLSTCLSCPQGGPGYCQCSRVNPNQTLPIFPAANHLKKSCDERFTLKLQSDSNLVLYFNTTPLWATNTVGAGATLAIMQSDGNFVLYAGTRILWQTRTAGNPGAFLSVQNDGNLVVYSKTLTPLWASNTCCH